jgi:transposase
VTKESDSQWSQPYGRILAVPSDAPEPARKLRAFAVQLIREELKEANGNAAEAAKRLGVGYSTFMRWLTPELYWEEFGDLWVNYQGYYETNQRRGRKPKRE